MAAFYRNARVEGATSGGSSDSTLPNGNCNFRNLASGRAPICGCKKFWLNTTSVDQKEFCFCGHHACFHSFSSQGTRASAPSSNTTAPNYVANQLGRNTPPGYYAVRHAGAGASPKPPSGLGIRQDARVQSHSQSINTRVWEALNGFARNQDDDVPSTAVPSENGDATVQNTRQMPPPVNIPQFRYGYEEYQGSATEVATPSIAGTPDLQAFAPPGSQARLSPAARFSPAPPPPPPPRQSIETAVQQHLSQNAAQGYPMSQQEVRTMLQDLQRRLDVVESLSYSTVPVEEVQDKFEHHDVRLLDLEQWRMERDQEREQASPEPPKASGSKQRRLLPDETASFGSSDSYDSRAAAHAEAAVLATIAANMENGPRFDALENRVSDLENASLPSFVRPWQVQVVLLPWGRDLRGIWFSSSESTQQSQQSAFPDSEEWTGAQSTNKLSFHSATSAAWTTESIQAWAEDAQDWLSPKACGPSGTVFQRLASRGLVKDVTLTASDPRHVLETLSRAFRRILPRAPPAKSELIDQYQGLKETFIPLRKVRKSTRLRFLSPAEMITSATWTAAFLDDSVLMKVNDGHRRLYVTTPHAYLQASKGGLSWHHLRELPARDANGEELAPEVSTHIAIEACWSYKDKLDYAPSLHSSFGSHATHRSIESSRPEHRSQAASQTSPHPLSPLSFHPPVRPRTLSLPSSTSLPSTTPNATHPKRRIASFESALPSKTPSTALGITNLKRRRLSSTSPEAENRGVNFTPRWSREPLSPGGEVFDPGSQGATSCGRKRGRGWTPAAYATPHSHTNFLGGGEGEVSGGFGGEDGSGDTELGTDLAELEGNEEEWEGVGDAGSGAEDGDEVMADETGLGGARSSYGEEEVESEDEEEEEGGLMVYKL